jgi:hypothetical protein
MFSISLQVRSNVELGTRETPLVCFQLTRPGVVHSTRFLREVSSFVSLPQSDHAYVWF